MVSFECCPHELLHRELHAAGDEDMEPAPASRGGGGVAVRRFSSGSKKLPNSKNGLRRLMKACWTQAPLEGSRCCAPPSAGSVASSSPLPSVASPLSVLPEDVLIECLARLPLASLQNSMLVCQRWRALMQSSQFYQHRQNVGKLESLLFVFGGSGNGLPSAVYCRSSGGWRVGPLFSPVMPALGGKGFRNAEHPQSLLHVQPVVMQQRIVVIGAVPFQNWGEDCTFIYDVWTNTLTPKAPMLCSRKKFACCVVGNRILVAGGASRQDPTRDPMMNAEEYLPELDTWRPLASMPHKRYGCLGIAVGSIFYVVGGLKSSSVIGMCMQPYTYISSMDAFDTKTNTWQKTKPLPIGGCVIACTAVGSCIYMLSSHAVELSFWRYDTQKDTWSRIKPPPIPSPLRMDNRLKFSCVTLGTCVYIIQVGGSIDDLLRRSGRYARGLKMGLVLIYDTILQEWSRGPDLPCIKNGAACAVVQC